MAKKIAGTIAQFGTKGYGFIVGDDGQRYFVHQTNVYNKSRLNIDTRVIFNTQNSEKGLVAVNVQLENPDSNQSRLSDGVIKGLFAVGFMVQIIVVYQVFFR